jgi:hypothetical protein
MHHHLMRPRRLAQQFATANSNVGFAFGLIPKFTPKLPGLCTRENSNSLNNFSALVFMDGH